jgi:DNA-binding transcriptional MerR regulator
MPGARVIRAFSENHVERLTALSKAQLRYWDRIGFFAPTYADENRRSPYSRIYSFRDVVGLRTLSLLRNEYRVSLQHLREVAAKLDHMRDTLWTLTTLYVVKRRVAIVRDKDKPPIDPLTGQYAIEGIALKAVINDVQKESAGLLERQPDQVGKISRNRYVSHNATVVAGTRIPTRAIKSFHDEGYSVEAIIRRGSRVQQ